MAKKTRSFDWQRQKAAEHLCLGHLDGFRKENPALARWEEKLKVQTSGRLLDWVDHLLVPGSGQLRDALTAAGFVRQQGSDREAWHHPGALLPQVVLTGNSAEFDAGVALRVESVADFLQINGLVAEIEGAPLSRFRRALVCARPGAALLVVERRGYRGDEVATPPPNTQVKYLAALESWQTRPRTGDNEEQALAEALRLADRLVAQLGADLAAHIVCRAERSYWLARNVAAGVQKHRQDRLGLGWANQDHLTFRSSRRHFARLVELFSRLGFHCRERFYAGKEAGWGAQIMENETAGLTLFLDVDLAPEEVAIDFATEELPERGEFGTVGLWCALHGDSIFQAGLHHLAARFDFARLTRDLAKRGIEFMAPFSDFSYLKQAFSLAERWPVAAQRMAGLVRAKVVSHEQEEKFLTRGAIGSHLESIQRGEGYKGFNRKNVSLIIRETDPRK